MKMDIRTVQNMLVDDFGYWNIFLLLDFIFKGSKV